MKDLKGLTLEEFIKLLFDKATPLFTLAVTVPDPQNPNVELDIKRIVSVKELEHTISQISHDLEKLLTIREAVLFLADNGVEMRFEGAYINSNSYSFRVKSKFLITLSSPVKQIIVSCQALMREKDSGRDVWTFPGRCSLQDWLGLVDNQAEFLNGLIDLCKERIELLNKEIDLEGNPRLKELVIERIF